MRIEVLGCSGGIGSGGGTTCLRVGTSVLIDCGTGLETLSTKALAPIEHVFLTHAHLDHLACLPMLADALLALGRGAPLTVHGPAASLESVRKDIFNGRIWPDFLRLPSAEAPAVRLRPLRVGEPIRLGSLRVEALPAEHVVPAVGYRVQDDRGTFVFGGDGTTNDALWVALNRGDRPDLIVLECSFHDAARDVAERSGHYAPVLLAKDLEKLAHDTPVGIAHIKPGAEDRVMEELRSRVPDRSLTKLKAGDVFEF